MADERHQRSSRQPATHPHTGNGGHHAQGLAAAPINPGTGLEGDDKMTSSLPSSHQSSSIPQVAGTLEGTTGQTSTTHQNTARTGHDGIPQKVSDNKGSMSHSSRQVSTRSVCTVAEKSGRMRNRRESAPNAVSRFSQPDRHKESTSRGSALSGNVDVQRVNGGPICDTTASYDRNSNTGRVGIAHGKTIEKMHLLWNKITSTDNQYGILSSLEAEEIIGNHMCRSDPAYAHLKSKGKIDLIGKQSLNRSTVIPQLRKHAKANGRIISEFQFPRDQGNLWTPPWFVWLMPEGYNETPKEDWPESVMRFHEERMNQMERTVRRMQEELRVRQDEKNMDASSRYHRDRDRRQRNAASTRKQRRRRQQPMAETLDVNSSEDDDADDADDADDEEVNEVRSDTSYRNRCSSSSGRVRQASGLQSGASGPSSSSTSNHIGRRNSEPVGVPKTAYRRQNLTEVVRKETTARVLLLWDKITSTDNQHGILSQYDAAEIIGNRICQTKPKYAHLKTKKEICRVGNGPLVKSGVILELRKHAKDNGRVLSEDQFPQHIRTMPYRPWFIWLMPEGYKETPKEDWPESVMRFHKERINQMETMIASFRDTVVTDRRTRNCPSVQHVAEVDHTRKSVSDAIESDMTLDKMFKDNFHAALKDTMRHGLVQMGILNLICEVALEGKLAKERDAFVHKLQGSNFWTKPADNHHHIWAAAGARLEQINRLPPDSVPVSIVQGLGSWAYRRHPVDIDVQRLIAWICNTLDREYTDVLLTTVFHGDEMESVEKFIKGRLDKIDPSEKRK
eukprot:GHVU01068953.1.p1 GENE.GHVU01068953.1~~GHVU01068953.1.p1  ORF type:complete len:817 (+),score=86.76 GHVU01068953.1:81-2453(+)